jgi:hypothetical protein
MMIERLAAAEELEIGMRWRQTVTQVLLDTSQVSISCVQDVGYRYEVCSGPECE